MEEACDHPPQTASLGDQLMVSLGARRPTLVFLRKDGTSSGQGVSHHLIVQPVHFGDRAPGRFRIYSETNHISNRRANRPSHGPGPYHRYKPLCPLVLKNWNPDGPESCPWMRTGGSACFSARHQIMQDGHSIDPGLCPRFRKTHQAMPWLAKGLEGETTGLLPSGRPILANSPRGLPGEESISGSRAWG